MSYVFVLDTNKQPLNPVHPAWARKLLSSGRAAVYKRYPFTIILKTAEEFGHPKVQADAKKPLKDAAAVNVTRWALYRRIKETGLPVEVGTGGRTKYNRSVRGLPKTHWLDAACVGASTPSTLNVAGIRPLVITAMGRGNRQICSLRSVVYFVNHPHGPIRFPSYNS